MNFFNTFAGDLAEKCSEKKQLVYNPLPHWIFEMGKKVCKQKQQNKQITKSANETKTTKKVKVKEKEKTPESSPLPPM